MIDICITCTVLHLFYGKNVWFNWRTKARTSVFSATYLKFFLLELSEKYKKIFLKKWYHPKLLYNYYDVVIKKNLILIYLQVWVFSFLQIFSNVEQYSTKKRSKKSCIISGNILGHGMCPNLPSRLRFPGSWPWYSFYYLYLWCSMDNSFRTQDFYKYRYLDPHFMLRLACEYWPCNKKSSLQFWW